MLYPSINELRKKADSRYTLVVLAAKRARDLIDGKPALVSDEIVKEVQRPVSVASYEIGDDLITYTRSDDAMDDAMDASAEAGAVEVAEEAEEIVEVSEEAEEVVEVTEE